MERGQLILRSLGARPSKEQKDIALIQFGCSDKKARVLPVAKRENGQDALLRRRSELLTFPLKQEDLQLIADMETTFYNFWGTMAGLSAPNVGVSKRVIMLKGRKGGIVTMVNPLVTGYSQKNTLGLEGCFSCDPRAWIVRPAAIEVIYFDLSGKPHFIKINANNSRYAQHEIDHLDGILIIDYPHLPFDLDSLPKDELMSIFLEQLEFGLSLFIRNQILYPFSRNDSSQDRDLPQEKGEGSGP